jgi:hypothetical protein
VGIDGSGGIILEFSQATQYQPCCRPSHIALGLDAGKKLMNDLTMAGIGGADEAVVADLPLLP